MKLTYFGHSACLLETSSHKLLIDPFLTGNDLCKISPDEVECDFILLTHGHADHVGDTVSIAKRTGATVIANFELAAYLQAKGVKNTHDMNHGGKCTFAFGTVKLTPAIHSSSATQDDGTSIYLGNPAGLLIEADGKTIYHAGDTCLTYDLKLIGEMHKVDLALLPIGDTYTMGIDDAAIATGWIKPGKVVPIHYDTFPPIKVDPKKFTDQVEKAGTPAIIMQSGESIEV